MAADISGPLTEQLRIVEIEEEFLASRPLSKPKKTWSLIVVFGFCVLFALINWRTGNFALTIFLGAVAALQLIEYQSSKQANHLYECGSEIIKFYRHKCDPRT